MSEEEKDLTRDYEPEAIDPKVSEPTSDVAMIPVVRSSSDPETEEDNSSGGFMRSLTSSIASSWKNAAEAEAALEWEEYDAEAAERTVAQREQEEASAGRHEFRPDPEFERNYSAFSAASAEETEPGTYHFPQVPSPYTGSQEAVRASFEERFQDTGDWSQTDMLGPQIPSGGQQAPDSISRPSTGSGPVPGSRHEEGSGEAPGGSGLISAPLSGETGALPSSPLRRGSVLRPSWLKQKLPEQLRRAGFDRSVFEPKIKPKQVQQAFRRLMLPEHPATGTVPIIDRLKGTPYANPQIAEQQYSDDHDELVTMAFVLDLGEALFRYGAGALEVETSIIAVTAAFGMKNTDVDITNQSISLNWAPEGKIPYSRIRVVRSWSGNYNALASVHELVTDIVSGRLTRSEAERRLDEIIHEPKPFPRWMITVCGAFFASFFASYLGAPILDAALGFVGTLGVLWLTRQLAAWRVPEYFCLAAGGFFASFLAMGAFTLEVDVTPSMVVAGTLMILLPSARVVSAIQDAINGFPITSAGRLVSAMIAFAGMTAGIMGAVVIWDLLGAPHIVVAAGLTRIYPFPILILLVFLAGMSAGVVEQARWRMLLPIGAISAIGFAAFYAGELLGLGERITPIIGATVVGALGRVVALRMGAPQLVVAVPAMMFMLPGLMVFRGMYQIAIENPETSMVMSMMSGLAELFNALIILLAISSGIVLGDVSMRRFTSGLQSNERSRARRR